MKIYFKIFLFFAFYQYSFCLEKNLYSISVCTTSSQEDANRCEKDILKTSKSETFILKKQNGTYSTYLGLFNSYEEAKKILNNSSNFIKKQKPFIKEIEKNKENNINSQNIQENIKIAEVDEEIKKLDENIILIEKEKTLAEEQQKEIETKRIKDERDKAEIENKKTKGEKDKALVEVQKIKDERDKALADEKKAKEEQELNEKLREEKDKALAETEKTKEEMEKLNKTEISSPEINHITTLENKDNFENLIIKIDSFKNTMFLKGKNKDGKIVDIKSYVVSTAKTSIKKPQGIGTITSISLNPEWNPTAKTIKAFKDKGINLPAVVPFRDKLNYMGAAKINLSHRVDGQEVYRIHGTLSENTIGTKESSGCIRMKNKEVVELASFLNTFSKTKSLNNISVILE